MKIYKKTIFLICASISMLGLLLSSCSVSDDGGGGGGSTTYVLYYSGIATEVGETRTQDPEWTDSNGSSAGPSSVTFTIAAKDSGESVNSSISIDASTGIVTVTTTATTTPFEQELVVTAMIDNAETVTSSITVSVEYPKVNLPEICEFKILDNADIRYTNESSREFSLEIVDLDSNDIFDCSGLTYTIKDKSPASFDVTIDNNKTPKIITVSNYSDVGVGKSLSIELEATNENIGGVATIENSIDYGSGAVDISGYDIVLSHSGTDYTSASGLGTVNADTVYDVQLSNITTGEKYTSGFTSKYYYILNNNKRTYEEASKCFRGSASNNEVNLYSGSGGCTEATDTITIEIKGDKTQSDVFGLYGTVTKNFTVTAKIP